MNSVAAYVGKSARIGYLAVKEASLSQQLPRGAQTYYEGSLLMVGEHWNRNGV